MKSCLGLAWLGLTWLGLAWLGSLNPPVLCQGQGTDLMGVMQKLIFLLCALTQLHPLPARAFSPWWITLWMVASSLPSLGGQGFVCSSSERGPQACQSAQAWQDKATTSWPTSGGTRPGDEGDLHPPLLRAGKAASETEPVWVPAPRSGATWRN